jgi:lipoprotein
MRKIIFKIVLIISTVFIVAFFLISCITIENHPEYLLEGARDDGFVSSYRAYFEIGNNGVNEISKTKYENYIYKDKDNHYKIVPTEHCSFIVNAKTKYSSDWECEKCNSNNVAYDTETLAEQLKKMEISGEARLNVEISKFDDFCIIEVNGLDDSNTIINSKYAIFYKGEKLSMKRGIELSSIRNIYKYHQ